MGIKCKFSCNTGDYSLYVTYISYTNNMNYVRVWDQHFSKRTFDKNNKYKLLLSMCYAMDNTLITRLRDITYPWLPVSGWVRGSFLARARALKRVRAWHRRRWTRRAGDSSSRTGTLNAPSVVFRALHEWVCFRPHRLRLLTSCPSDNDTFNDLNKKN